MERIKKRLEQLEAHTPPTARARPGHVTGADLRRLEEHIKRLESGAGEVGTAPEAPVIKSVEPDNELAAVVRELEWLEELERAGGEATKGGRRWGT